MGPRSLGPAHSLKGWAKLLKRDEARRIVANVAKLTELLTSQRTKIEERRNPFPTAPPPVSYAPA